MEKGEEKKRARPGEGAGDPNPRGGKERARVLSQPFDLSRSASLETPAAHQGADYVSDTEPDKHNEDNVRRLEEEGQALRQQLAMLELEKAKAVVAADRGELPTAPRVESLHGTRPRTCAPRARHGACPLPATVRAVSLWALQGAVRAAVAPTSARVQPPPLNHPTRPPCDAARKSNTGSVAGRASQDALTAPADPLSDSSSSSDEEDGARATRNGVARGGGGGKAARTLVYEDQDVVAAAVSGPPPKPKKG